TPTEARLAEIWADVLDVERVGIHDSFFDLGGASFASLAIATRANEADIPLSADLLFAYPTIAALSDLAAEMSALSPEDAAPLAAPPPDPPPAGLGVSLSGVTSGLTVSGGDGR
ncbi:MAG: phosphopantetheine-binding protein, partial [Chloroflexota bacterium]